MTLQHAITNWQGKSAADISDIYQRYQHSDNFVQNLLQYMQQSALQKGATWLLKCHLESHGTVPANAVYKRLSQLQHWQSKLHILQCIPYLPIGSSDKHGLEVFLRQCLTDNNKFVRAWAYNGFHLLACQYGEYREETEQFLRMAMRDEAPSVQARVRNILKQGF